MSRLPLPNRVPRTKGEWAVALVVLLVAAVLWGCQARDAGTPQDAGWQEPTHSPSISDRTTPRSPSGGSMQTAPQTDPTSGLAFVEVDELPREAAETLELIDAGGPFPYDRDGVTFGNREGILPQHERGYYREYTVPTPGEDDRGARRIVTGDGGEYYWTEDHYASFRRISR